MSCRPVGHPLRGRALRAEVQRRRLAGERPGAIAKALGLTPSYVSMLLRQPPAELSTTAPQPGDRIPWMHVPEGPGWTLIRTGPGEYALRMGQLGGQWVCVPEDMPGVDGGQWVVENYAIWSWQWRKERYNIVTVIESGLPAAACTAEHLRELAHLFEFAEASRA